MLKFTLGSDPEFIVVDEKGTPVAMCGLFGGTKEIPEPITELGEGYFKSEDNVLIEFNVPPSDTVKKLLGHINKCIKYANKEVKKINPGYKVSFLSSGEFDVSHRQAQVFGCDPSYSVIRGNIESFRPDPSAVGKLRSSACHIHFGINVLEKVTKDNFILLCDLYLGIPSLIVDNTEDAVRRKHIYGNLSDFRISKHTIEYRTLGTSILNYPDFLETQIQKLSDAIGVINPQEYILDLEEIDYLMLRGKDYKEAATQLNNKLNELSIKV